MGGVLVGHRTMANFPWFRPEDILPHPHCHISVPNIQDNRPVCIFRIGNPLNRQMGVVLDDNPMLMFPPHVAFMYQTKERDVKVNYLNETGPVTQHVPVDWTAQFEVRPPPQPQGIWLQWYPPDRAPW